MSICLIDTGILCEILKVPSKHGRFGEPFAELKRKERLGESLLIPVSAIVETGNHIGQNGDGRLRRQVALDFLEIVERALRGNPPYIRTPFFTPELFSEWVADFPGWAARGSGLGDLTILKEFERQCRLHPRRRVYIWSTDRHLSSYHREP